MAITSTHQYNRSGYAVVVYAAYNNTRVRKYELTDPPERGSMKNQLGELPKFLYIVKDNYMNSRFVESVVEALLDRVFYGMQPSHATSRMAILDPTTEHGHRTISTLENELMREQNTAKTRARVDKQNQTVKVKVNGEEVEMTAEDMTKIFVKNSDYSRKIQGLRPDFVAVDDHQEEWINS